MMPDILNMISIVIDWIIKILGFVKDFTPTIVKDNLLILIIIFGILGWYLANKIYAAKISQTNLAIILTILMFLVFVLL